MISEKEKINVSDWLLFPEYWQVNSLYYGWQKRIFPSINTYHLGHDKIEMTRLFQALIPENTPYTKIMGYNPQKNIKETEDKILSDFSYPFIAKKTRSSEGKGVYLIENRYDLYEYLTENSILYFQEYLPIKKDLRIVFIGNKVFSAYWRIGQEGNFKNNLAQDGRISYDNIPKEAIDLVESLARKAGINHAGFDVVIHEDRFYILEFNVLFGNQGLVGKSKAINDEIYRYLIKDSISNKEGSKDHVG